MVKLVAVNYADAGSTPALTVSLKEIQYESPYPLG